MFIMTNFLLNITLFFLSLSFFVFFLYFKVVYCDNKFKKLGDQVNEDTWPENWLVFFPDHQLLLLYVMQLGILSLF